MSRSARGMGFASITTGAFVVLAACTAVYNLWLHALRPQERAHLWLGVAAFGVVGVGTGMAILYEARDLATAQSAQTIALSSAPLLVTGFLRFTSVFLGVRMRALEWTSGLFTIGFVVLFNLNPELFFSGEAIEASVLGVDYVEAKFRPTIALALPGFLLMFAALIVIFGRNRTQLEGGGLIFTSIVVWTRAAGNDVGLALGLYRGPYLVTMGFAAFAMAFTGLLVRRFVASVEQLEADAEMLQLVVEDKSRELREKDHQLIHGSRMATVGAISAGLAQEIHQPVSVVAANLEELESAFKDPGEADRFDELLGEAREGVDRIRVVVSDLLRISRRDASDDGAVSLVRAVESVLPIAQSEARTRAQIRTDLSPVPPVHGSETLLSQVVLNLVVNALHAIPEGDPEANAVTVRTSFEDGSVWLTVEDTGPGIPEDQIPGLFDPFGAAPGADSGGVGLGLAVTYQLVCRHRGRLEVENGPNGARFIVQLPPLADEAAP